MARVDEHGVETFAFEALQQGRIFLLFSLLNDNPEIYNSIEKFISWSDEAGWFNISNELKLNRKAYEEGTVRILSTAIPSSLFDFR